MRQHHFQAIQPAFSLQALYRSQYHIPLIHLLAQLSNQFQPPLITDHYSPFNNRHTCISLSATTFTAFISHYSNIITWVRAHRILPHSDRFNDVCVGDRSHSIRIATVGHAGGITGRFTVVRVRAPGHNLYTMPTRLTGSTHNTGYGHNGRQRNTGDGRLQAY